MRCTFEARVGRSCTRTHLPWVCLIWLAICIPSKAIDRDRRIDQLLHTAWTSKDGAPGRARTVVQTSDGFLWFAGQTGLYRFDGVRFDRYDLVSGVQLPKTDVSSLVALPDGSLLIGWSLGGVSLLKDGQVTDYGGPGSGFPENGQVDWFAKAPDGAIWAVMFYQPAYRLDAGGHWHEFGPGCPISGHPTLFTFDRLGTLWMGSEKKTFFRPPGETQFQEFPEAIESIAETPDGVLWAIHRGNIRPIHHYVPGARILTASRPADLGDLIFGDSQGSLWGFHTGQGLFRISHPERPVGGSEIRLEKFTSADGLTSDNIGHIFQDREENLWLTTSKGIDRFSQSNVVPVKLPTSGGYAFLDSSDKGIRFSAVYPQTLMTVTDGVVEKAHPWPFATLYAYHGRHDITWLGTLNQGLAKGANYRFQQVDSLSKAVGSITEDEKGRVWAIFAGKGANRLENGKWTSLADLGGAGRCFSAFTDGAGRIWFGCIADHVVLLDHDELHILAAADGLDVGNALDIREIAGHIFVGGDRGLQMFNGKRFVPVVPKDADPFRNIWALLASDRSGLWFAEARGIAHIPLEELRQIETNPNHAVSFEIFDVHDGLSEELQRAAYRPASMESSDGKVWFATQTGLVWIDPKRILHNRIPPNISIGSLTADGKVYHFFSPFTLPPRTTGIRIAFTATSLTIPERVRFRYWLEGVDKHWQDAGTRREAFYTNLGPGAFRFRVIACNNDGVWNETGAAVLFMIAPTFYQTIWFRLSTAFVFALMAGAAFRWRMRRMAASLNERFQERLEERSRLARDFHDTLLQTIQGSKMIADAALLQRADLPQMRSTMEELSEWLGRAVHEGRSALSAFRSSLTEGNELAGALRRAGEEYRFQHPMELNLVVEGSSQETHPIVRDEVYRVGYEAIRNAFTHSGGSHVDVELSYVNDLALSVRDDGGGIQADADRTKKEGHFGMIGMHERAARIGAKLTISTSPTGTEVELRVPRSIAFQRAAQGSQSMFQRLKDLF